MAEFRNLPLRNLHESGIAPDAPRTALAPHVWSDGRNIRFNDGAVEKINGTTSIYNQSKTDTTHLTYWATPGAESYVYVTNSPTEANVFRVAQDGTETEITRSTAYTPANLNNERQRWQSSVVAGGYAIILNNRLDAPQYILEDEFDDGLLRDIPGWNYLASAETGGTPTMVGGTPAVHTTAGVIEAYGSVLIAGDLTYYSSTDIRNAATTNTRAPSTVRVSGRADRGNIPRTWDPFPVPVPTGGITFETEFELADTSPVTAIAGLQGNAFIFTQTAIHQMTPDLGDANITTNTRGALNAQTVLEANGTLYCVGSDDIYTFSGHPSSVQSIADTRVREEFFQNLHPNFLENVFMVHNTEFNEVWICYPRVSSVDGFCDEALIFNYINNTWTRKDMDNVVYGVTGPSTGGGVAGHTLTLSGRSLDQGQAAQQEIQTYTVGGTVPSALVAEQQTQTVAGTAASTFTQEVFTLGVDDDIIPTNRAQSTHAFSGNSGTNSRDLGTVTGTTGNANSMNIGGVTGFNLTAVAAAGESTYTLTGVPAGSNIELVVGGITLTQFNLTTTFEDTDVTRTWSLTGTVPVETYSGTTLATGLFDPAATGTASPTGISGFTGLDLTAVAVQGVGIEPFAEAATIANTVETMSYTGGTVDTLRYTDIPPTAQAANNSGWAGRGVGVSNEWLAIGNNGAPATIDGTPYTNAGQITVFRWNDTTSDWDYHQNILPTTVNTTAPTGSQAAPADSQRNPNLTQSAGVVVSADGMWMAATRHASTGLIDAPSSADNRTFVGEAIEFYQFNTTTELWERNGEVALNHTESNANFVHPSVTHMSMSPNGEWVAAIGDRTFNDGTDEFYIINFFRRTGTTWTLAQTNRSIIDAGVGGVSTNSLYIKLNNDHAIAAGGGSLGNFSVLQLVGNTWTAVQSIPNTDFLANGYVGNVNDLDSDIFSLSGNSLFMYVHNSFTTVREFVRTGLNQPFDLSSGAMSSNAITGLVPNAFASGAVFSTADGLTLGLVRSGTSAGGGVTGYARIYTRASLTDPFVRTFEQVGGVNGAQPQPISGSSLTQYNDGFFAKDTMGTLSFELVTAEASPDPVRVYRGVNAEAVEYTLTNGSGQAFNTVTAIIGGQTFQTGAFANGATATQMFNNLEARAWSVSFGTADGFTLSGAGITPVTTAVSFPGDFNANQMAQYFADYVNNQVDGATATVASTTTIPPEPSADVTDFWGNFPGRVRAGRPGESPAADGSLPTGNTWIFQSSFDTDNYSVTWEGSNPPVVARATRAELVAGVTGTDGAIYFADDANLDRDDAFAFTEFGTPPNLVREQLYFPVRRSGPPPVVTTLVRTRNTTPLVMTIPAPAGRSGSGAVANMVVENAGARLTEYAWNIQGPPDAGSAGMPTNYAGGTYDGVVITDNAEDIVTDLANDIITTANTRTDIPAGHAWTVSAVTQEAGHRVIHITSPDSVDRSLTVNVRSNDGAATTLNEGLGNAFDGGGETAAMITIVAPPLGSGGSHTISAFSGESIGSLISRIAATVTSEDETPDWTAAPGIGDPLITLGLVNTVNFNANSDILSFVNPPDAGTLEEGDRVIIEGSPTAAVNGVYEVEDITGGNITQLDRVGEVFTTSGTAQFTTDATIRRFGITYTADNAGSHDGVWRLIYMDGSTGDGDIVPAVATVSREGSDRTWAANIGAPSFGAATTTAGGIATTLNGVATELAAAITADSSIPASATATGAVVTMTSTASDWFNSQQLVGTGIFMRDRPFTERELNIALVDGVQTIGANTVYANGATFTTTSAQMQQGHPIVPQSMLTVDYADVTSVIDIDDNATANAIASNIRAGIISRSGLDATGADAQAVVSVTNLTPGLAAPTYTLDDWSENVRVGSNGMFPASADDTDRGIFAISETNVIAETDRERPWPGTIFNFSREFVVTISTTADIHTNDIGYTFGNDPYESFVERRDLLLRDLVDNTYVKSLNELNIMGTGSEGNTNVTLDVNLNLTNAPGVEADLTNQTGAENRYTFTFSDDYKIDVRENGRMLNYRITDMGNATIRWRISGIDLMAAVSGTR